MAHKGKKVRRGKGQRTQWFLHVLSNCAMGFEKISHCEPPLVFGWEGTEDPAILPLADGIFHLFVTLMAVL